MKLKKWAGLIAGAVMAAGLVLTAQADGPTEITFWHAMGGVNGETLESIVKDFNESQDEVHVNTE